MRGGGGGGGREGSFPEVIKSTILVHQRVNGFYLSIFPNLADISLFRLSLQMNCTLQMQFCLGDLPSPIEVCNHHLQSADESCPNRAKTRRSDYQNRVCNHSKRGRNQQSHLASSETPSNLHQLFSDHRTLQIHPNHQD